MRDFEPRLALDGGADGLDFYRAICRNWRVTLRDGGRLMFEVGIGQAETVRDLLRGNGYADVRIADDPGGIPRVVWGTVWKPTEPEE